MTSLTLVCANGCRTINNTTAAVVVGPALRSGRFQAGFREGNADTHHSGLQVIALISQNYYQRKCQVPKDSSPVNKGKGKDRLCVFVSSVAQKILPL